MTWGTWTDEHGDTWTGSMPTPPEPEPLPRGFPWGRALAHAVITTFWLTFTFIVWVTEPSPAGVAIMTWVCFAGAVFTNWLVTQA